MEEVARLRLHQPGFDGGKIKRRFERRSYPDGLLRSPTVLQALLNLLVVKVNDLHMSEGTLDMLLAAKRQDYRQCKHTAHLADLVPTCCKAAMTALEDAGAWCLG